MPRHTCPSANRVAPAGYASVNFRGWNASITGFGKWQKKPSEHNLQERQSSTSSIPYGECIDHPRSQKPQNARNRWQWRCGEISFLTADCHGLALYVVRLVGGTSTSLVNIAHLTGYCCFCWLAPVPAKSGQSKRPRRALHGR